MADRPEMHRFTQDQLVTEALRRFGTDPTRWAFVCPRCGDVATSGDFPMGSEQLGQYCVGNFAGSNGRRAR